MTNRQFMNKISETPNLVTLTLCGNEIIMTSIWTKFGESLPYTWNEGSGSWTVTMARYITVGTRFPYTFDTCIAKLHTWLPTVEHSITWRGPHCGAWYLREISLHFGEHRVQHCYTGIESGAIGSLQFNLAMLRSKPLLSFHGTYFVHAVDDNFMPQVKGHGNKITRLSHGKV